MGQQQSKKGELLYQRVIEGNVDAIRDLRRDGAGLEWADNDGKTPLIVASMDSGHYIVAKTLIELGANVNAYRPGRNAGTPLHHAAKRGIDQTIKLLLSHGANPFLTNDDCQTPLDVARAKGFTHVVRSIEGHICSFSGHIREILGPGFLEVLAPQLLSRKVWAVVIPNGPQNPSKPPKLELVIYQSTQDAQPRTTIALWKSKIEEPRFHRSGHTMIIHDNAGHRYKFEAAVEGDKQQFWQLYNACKGAPRAIVSQLSGNPGTSTSSAGTSASASDSYIYAAPGNNQSAMSSTTAEQTSAANGTNGWGDIMDSAGYNQWVSSTKPSPSAASTSGWLDEPTKPGYNGWDIPDPKGQTSSQPPPDAVRAPAYTAPTSTITSVSGPAAPSAPPVPPVPVDGPINYPTIDSSPVDVAAFGIKDHVSAWSTGKGTSESSCVICWEAPVKGACVPCGHMAGCISCLNEIKAKNGTCPVCRSKIEQIITLYAV